MANKVETKTTNGQTPQVDTDIYKNYMEANYNLDIKPRPTSKPPTEPTDQNGTVFNHL